MHYEHLKTRQTSAVQPLNLAQLQRTNIICGKNNSGKTQILNVLVDNEYCKAAISRDKFPTDAIIKNTVDNTSFPKNPDEVQKYKHTIIDSAHSEEVWTEFDAEKFAAAFLNNFRRYLGNWDVSEHHVKNAFIQVVQPQPTRVLISPKRTLDCPIKVNSDENANPRGSGIINALFFSKNQSVNSPEFAAFENLHEAFMTITNGVTLEIRLERSSSLELYFTNPLTNQTLPARDCGLGFQDLIVILYFVVYPGASVLLIEEPENHLHPEAQRRLFEYMHRESSKQFFITTHSNVFLDETFAEKVYLTDTLDGKICLRDATSRAQVLSSLGYSIADNLVSDLAILVEGPNDKTFIAEMLVKSGIAPNKNIAIWLLGGDNMIHHDLEVFKESYKLIALIDSDPGSDHIRRAFTDKCKELDIPVTKLSRYAIENYVPLTAYREVYDDKLSSSITALQPDKPVKDQIGFNPKGKMSQLARLTEIEDIADTDIGSFLEDLKQMLSP